MKTIGKIIGVTIEVTVGAFVAGWMFEAGRDAYRQDRREVIKEETEARVQDLKQKSVKAAKSLKEKAKEKLTAFINQ